jgi:hypothetical protein
MFENQRATRRIVPDLDLDRIGPRWLQDLFTSALAGQWERRAKVFESCRPRPGDFLGRATRAQVADHDRRLAELAAGCRLHAALLRGDDLNSFTHLFDIAVYVHGSPVEPLEVVA